MAAGGKGARDIKASFEFSPRPGFEYQHNPDSRETRGEFSLRIRVDVKVFPYYLFSYTLVWLFS